MSKNTFCLVFKADELLVKVEDENIIIPKISDLKALGMDIKNFDTLKLASNDCLIYTNINSSIIYDSQFKFIKLRALIGLMNVSLFNMVAKAYHILRWNNTNKYCSKCGSLVKDKKDEIAKICPECGFVIYPRISPAIITAVVNGDKLLLAHNTRFNKGFYSVIAGFVEPGETLEDCVSREVFEEVGIHVKNIKYFDSQPWPFPDSLMIGFTCEYAGGDLKVDGIEIDDAGFFSPDDFPNLPLPGTIARRLVDWFTARKK